MSVADLQRSLAARHDELRAQGLNPLEAIEALARELPHGPDAPTLLWTAFQQFVTTDLRGAFGQYLTPPPVAEHVGELLALTRRDGTLLDPFAGSGILLDAAARRGDYKLVGVEINQPVATVAAAALSLAGHDVELTVGDAFAAWASGTLPVVDAVVTNPPFGAQLSTLAAAALPLPADSAIHRMNVVPVELLALELCLDVLAPGGVLVAVLPQSVLTNRRRVAFRTQLFERYTLRHVTTLPEETFVPFRGVATSCVVVIDKTPPSARPLRVSWVASRSVGYDRTGRAGTPSDLPAIAAAVADRTAPQRVVAADGSPVAAVAEAGGHRLGDLAEIWRGKTPPRDADGDGGAFLLRVGDLAGSFVSWRARARAFVPASFYAANPRKHLRAGDICFTGSAHTPRYIAAKVDLVSAVPAGGAMPSGEVVVVRVRDGAPVAPVDLLYWLRSDAGRTAVQALVRGSTAHVYPKDLAELAVPPLGADPTLARLHAEAEAHYREYQHAEDEITTHLGRGVGAGDGNRTRTVSLGS